MQVGGRALVVEHLPLAQGVIPESRDRVQPAGLPRMEPASPSACLSLSGLS